MIKKVLWMVRAVMHVHVKVGVADRVSQLLPDRQIRYSSRDYL